MPTMTQDRLQARITGAKEKLTKLSKESPAKKSVERDIHKRLKRAQRRLRVLQGKPRPRKIFRTIIRPAAKALAGSGQAKKK